MFEAAVTRLTLWYLAVIMVLSAMFSVALYNVSTRELTEFQRQQEIRQEVLLRSDLPPSFRENLIEAGEERLRQVEESKYQIAVNLARFNLLILALGGVISYLLAKRTLKPIEDAVEVQNRFTADASHELRTPLTAMRSEIEVALRDPDLTLKESKRLHTSTLEEIGRLESLTKGLLQLARQDFQAMQRSFRECSLKEVVEEGAKKVAPIAARKGIALEMNLADGRILCDHWSLAELVAILLDNAVKYSGAGSTVTVESQAAHRSATISIKDQGNGISPADLPHIFDRFYRADSSRSKEVVEGYGLGLSLAKQIADAHRAVIRVESKVGEGSLFTVRLPIDYPKK